MKRGLSLIVSLIILAVIYAQIGSVDVWYALTTSAPIWVALGVAMFIPQVLLTTGRFQQLLPTGTRLSFAESLRLILAAGSLNMVLPSKMGDIAKAWFMARHHAIPGGLAASLVLFERTADMLALLLWGAFGLLLYPAKDGLFWVFTLLIGGGLLFGVLFLFSARIDHMLTALIDRLLPRRLSDKAARLTEQLATVRAHLRTTPGLLRRIAITSVLLWFLHLVQIWLFVRAVSHWMPLVDNLALAPLAILAGLIPLTFAGVGTRDAAVVLLYAPFLGAPEAAALGLFFTLRYVITALPGLVYLRRYMHRDPP